MGDDTRRVKGVTPKEVRLGLGETTSDTEARFRNVLAASRDIIYQLNLRTMVYDYVSPSVEPTLGYPPEDFIAGGLELVASLTHPDDVERIREQVRLLTETGGDPDFEPMLEYRLRTKSGEYRWMSDSHTIVRDQDGMAVALVGNVRDVTARRVAEEATRESEARFRLAASSEVVTLFEQDLDLRYTWVYPQHPEFPKGNIGRTDEELAPAEDAAAIVAAKREVLETGTGLRREVRVGLPAGTRWYDLIIEPKRDSSGRIVGVAGVALDVSERRHEEQTRAFLADASSMLTASLDYEATLSNLTRLAVPRLADWCDVHLLEEDGSPRRLARAHVDPNKVVWADELDRRYPPDPNAPYGVPNVVRTGRSEFYAEISDEMLAEGAVDAEHLELLRQVGFTSAMIVPLAARGRTLGAITLVWAESRRRYTAEDLAVAEDLARRAALAIENATLYRDALRANRVKDEFLATVSHELRTPLNAVLGWSRLLGSGTLDEEGRARAATIIERNAASQAQLIEDLLDVSRIISGKLRIGAEPVDLVAVVRAAIDSASPAAEAKNIRVEAGIDGPAVIVTGDAGRLQQVVWNLLSNAIKFTPEGGRVEVALGRDDGHATVSVRDTGRGISREFLPFVFERFLQADGSTTRRYGGLGLGLAIVRHIAELHGGTVSAESEGEELGSTFTLRLPLATERRRERAAPARPVRRSIDLSGVRVLCVDDEPDARELLETGLAVYGARVRTSASAGEALEALEGWAPDVIVSDIAMPDEDGYSFLRRVRALPGGRGEVPVLALTALARADDRERVFAAGFQAYCRKPCDMEDVATAVEGLVRGR